MFQTFFPTVPNCTQMFAQDLLISFGPFGFLILVQEVSFGQSMHQLFTPCTVMVGPTYVLFKQLWTQLNQITSL